MALSIGNTEPTTIYLGDQELDAIYLGDQEIWRKNTGVQPIHRMAGDSTDLPLSTGEGYIPDLINPQATDIDQFVAHASDAYKFDKDTQIWSVNNKIQMAHDADIGKYINNRPEEFMIKFKYSGLQTDSIIAEPDYGYEFMYCGNDSETGRLDIQYYLSYNNWHLVIVLQRGFGPPTLDVTGHTTGTTSNGLYFSDIDFAWLQNNGDGREFTVCLKNGVVYFYIDDVLFCHQDYHTASGQNGRYDKMFIGTRFTVMGGHLCPTMQVDKFEIYDTCIFPST